jgi:predicted lipoprotein with Yx(FWY)xxD motif
LAGATVAAATTLAACASSSGGGSASPAAGGSTSSSAASSAVSLETHSGPLGTFLTDGQGRTIYMFTSDTATRSTCDAQCLAFWPPVLSTTTPSVSGGASMTALGTLKLANGSMQVTYGGHPLYYFAEDSAPGQTNGQGSTDFGARWWLLTAKATPITGAAAVHSPASPASPAKPSSSSSSPAAAGGWA